MTTATAHRLPATDKAAPSDEFTVSSLKQHETMDGVSFAANVRRKGRKGVVGRIENEGRGGPTTFYCLVDIPETTDAGGNKTWDNTARRECVSAWRQFVADFPDESLTYPSMREEEVADLLVTEYEVAKTLNRMAEKGQTPVLRPDENPAEEGVSFYRVPLDARLLTRIVANEPTGTRVWDGNGWVLPQEVDA